MKNKRNIMSILLLVLLFMESVIGGERCVLADVIEEAQIEAEQEAFFDENAVENQDDAEGEESLDEIEEVEETPKDSEENKTDVSEEDTDNIQDVINGVLETVDMIFDETETSQEDTTEKIKITAENFDDVLTSGGSISIEKYEIDESELSDSAKKAINYSNYSLLKFADKHTLFDELKLREDTMLSCEKFGLAIKESYPYAIIMQRMDSDMAYAVQLIRNFKSEKVALDETQKYSKGKFKYAFLSEEDVKNSFIELLAKGNIFDDILNAYVVSCAVRY